MSNSIIKTAIVLLASLFLLVIPPGIPTAAAKDPRPTAKRAEMVPGELVVVFRPGHSTATLSTDGSRLMAKSRSLGESRRGTQFARVKLRSDISLEQAIETLRSDPAVEAVAPNYLNYHFLAPNDSRYAEMWGLNNTPQTIASPVYTTNNPGTADADIDAPEAWDVQTGSTSVVVAVIDSGVDYTHPDLAGAMWDATSATTPSNFFGYDFADGDTDPYPLNSNHGTHVAGTIAATGSNAIGIPGVAYGAKIMALKVFPDLGGGATDADIISAINYAVANNANIINMSLGRGGVESSVFTTAVQSAVNSGVLVVVAAGNGGTDGIGDSNDSTPQWPANYASHASTSAGTISALATDQADQRASFSNYGTTSVSVGAPGVNILSTVTGRSTQQSETLGGVSVGTDTRCSSSPTTCMDNTIFDAGGVSSDCTGPSCKWGVYKPISTFRWIRGDKDAASGYAPNIDGTIVSQVVNVAGAQRVVLRYAAAWELGCNTDYVDVEVYDGSTWQLLHAADLNINDSRTALCTPDGHTHTGRTYPEYGVLDVAHDITAYANASLRVRFRFVSDGSTSYSIIGGFVMTDIYVDVQASDYANSYELFNGTSMATPMTSGIAALVKSRYPGYSAPQLKTAVVNTGDTVSSLANLVSSGRRVNARNALVAPAIASLSPASATNNGPAFTLTVNGVNFENSAIVRWNGLPLTTTFVSPTQLTASVPASNINNPGFAAVTVNNPGVNITSTSQTFTISGPPVAGGGGSGGGGGCFIATAAFGTPMAEDVRYLRAFRDQHLLDNDAGRWFVEQYYKLSPPLADFIREHEGLKSLVRAGLTPVVELSKLLVNDEALKEQTADRP